jgi:hypothetical protein
LLVLVLTPRATPQYALLVLLLLLRLDVVDLSANCWCLILCYHAQLCWFHCLRHISHAFAFIRCCCQYEMRQRKLGRAERVSLKGKRVRVRTTWGPLSNPTLLGLTPINSPRFNSDFVSLAFFGSVLFLVLFGEFNYEQYTIIGNSVRPVWVKCAGVNEGVV